MKSQLCSHLDYQPNIAYCNNDGCEYASKNKIPYIRDHQVAGRKYECKKFSGSEVKYHLIKNKPSLAQILNEDNII